MKKLFAFILLFIAVIASAQNKKGNLLVGASIGSGSISSENTDYAGTGESESNSFKIDVLPMVGLYVTNKIVVGANFGIGYYHDKYTSTSIGSSEVYKNKLHYISFKLGPYGRFYFGNGNKGMPFAEINGALTFYGNYENESKSNTYNGTTTYKKYHPYEAGVKFGYEHFINNLIGIQYYLGYTYSHYKYESLSHTIMPAWPDRTDHQSAHTGSLDFGAGLVIHLECQKKKK